jgi:aspartyl-tRNA(Asn)/glutamyl-tRNA(Gln) amidotransferase subunit A
MSRWRVRRFPGIQDVAPRLRAGELFAVDVVDACLARIEELNPRLNAFITVLTEQAREQARTADADIKAGRWRGPLHGIPVGIKDFYDTANVPTTAAFEPFRNRVPKRDAAAVEALKDAGAIVIGKTNMHQLGAGTTGLESFFGPVRNPVNDAFIPGGSSSGSAAAVATGMCYATLDTDAIGSCRLPAACCGVVGFKPTFGAISTKGILDGEKVDETIQWLSHAGVTTRSVDDTTMVFDALVERLENAEATTDPRIGIAGNFTADAEVMRAFEEAVDMVRTLGYPMAPARAPFDTPAFGDLSSIKADRATIRDRAFGGIDVLLLPTTVTAVLTVEDAKGKPQALSPGNTMFANYFGVPAISVPCGVDSRGLPVGLQIVGKPRDEGTVLRLAREFDILTARA